MITIISFNMEWQVVNKKSKNRIRAHQTGTISMQYNVGYLDFEEKIAKVKAFIAKQPWANHLARACKGKIVAVGLGNFSCSDYSITQHALYEFLIDFYSHNGELYDPSYLIEEIKYLENKGFEVNSGEFLKNRENSCTFIMIHCHFSLYENLLRQAWVEFCDLVVVGNNFVEISQNFRCEKAVMMVNDFEVDELVISDLAFSNTFVNKKIKNCYNL